MYITVSELSKYWNIAPTGVLHVGAHLGEEASDYEKFGWTPAIWVEAQPNLVEILATKLDSSKHKVIEAAVWEEDGVPLKLHIASNSQSTSLLNFGTHSDFHPDITYVSEVNVLTKRLDSLIKPEEMPNFVNLDIQGVELSALKGLGKLLDFVDYIYTEVNRTNVYRDCSRVEDIDSFLKLNGFRRASTRWLWLEGWGDALYIRNDVSNRRKLQIFRYFFHQIFFYKPQAKRILWTIVINLSHFYKVRKH